jgi:TIR domain/SPOR domain
MRRAAVRVVCATADIAAEREVILTVVLPQLTELLARRDVTLEVVNVPTDAEDPEAGELADELTAMSAPGTFTLCVVSSSQHGLGFLPRDVADRFPHLAQYQRASRTELICRHLLSNMDADRGIFVLCAEHDPAGAAQRVERADGLMKVIEETGTHVLWSGYTVGRAEPEALDELRRKILGLLWRIIVDSEESLPLVTSEPYLDENVQFTVYRPRAVRPAVWYDMLAFAHLAERRPDAPEDEPDPRVRVRHQAEQALGERLAGYDDRGSDSRMGVPRSGELTFLPEIPGVEFNPERRVFRWQEDVHREEFRLRASPELIGQVARGRLSVYLGAIIIAEVALAFRVDHQAPASAEPEIPRHVDHVRPYRKIFASYSHQDVEVVRQFELLARSLGDQYLRDVVTLRAGSDWDEGLLRMIDDADVFQLFWSSNSMRSPYVRREWEYALSLARPYFVRPTYWETPLPSSQNPELPPLSLRRLHFHQIAAAEPAHQTSSPPPQPTPMMAPPRQISTTSDEEPRRPRRHRRVLVAPLALAILAGSVFTGLILSQSSQRGGTAGVEATPSIAATSATVTTSAEQTPSLSPSITGPPSDAGSAPSGPDYIPGDPNNDPVMNQAWIAVVAELPRSIDSEAEAQLRVTELAGSGLPARYLDTRFYPRLLLGGTPPAKGSFLVFVGPFETQAEAENMCAEIAGTTGEDCFPAQPDPP